MIPEQELDSSNNTRRSFSTGPSKPVSDLDSRLREIINIGQNLERKKLGGKVRGKQTSKLM